MFRQQSGRKDGQSIIETVVGIIVLIPIVLFLFDVAVLVLANTANDNLAKQAARAAASAVQVNPSTQQMVVSAAGYPTNAWTAAQNVVSQFKTSSLIDKVEVYYMSYDAGAGNVATQTQDLSGLAGMPGGALPSGYNTDPQSGNVAVVTGIHAQAPVPFPGFDSSRVFWARDVEPIVSLPPG